MSFLLPNIKKKTRKERPYYKTCHDYSIFGFWENYHKCLYNETSTLQAASNKVFQKQIQKRGVEGILF